jgi:hypothetical protein
MTHADRTDRRSSSPPAAARALSRRRVLATGLKLAFAAPAVLGMAQVQQVAAASRPSRPDRPARPERPSRPARPERPATPAPPQPTQPSQPSQPTQPSQPSQPTKPSQPTQPESENNGNGRRTKLSAKVRRPDGQELNTGKATIFIDTGGGVISFRVKVEELNGATPVTITRLSDGATVVELVTLSDDKQARGSVPVDAAVAQAIAGDPAGYAVTIGSGDSAVQGQLG